MSKSSSYYLLIFLVLLILLGLFGLPLNPILWRRFTFLTLRLITIIFVFVRLGRLCAPRFLRCIELLEELLCIPGWNL